MMHRIFFILLVTLAVISCKENHEERIRCFKSQYSREQLEFFLDTFGQDRVVRRWNSDINISCHGDHDTTVLSFVDSLIAEFQPLLPDLKIRRVAEHGNVRFHFMKRFRNQDVSKHSSR